MPSHLLSTRTRLFSIGLAVSLLVTMLTGVAAPPALADPDSTTGWIVPVGGDRIAFSPDDTSHGNELWVADVVTGAAHQVIDLDPGSGNGVQDDTPGVWFDGHVYAAALSSPDELWRFDVDAGTAELVTVSSGSISEFGVTPNGVVYDDNNQLLRAPAPGGSPTVLRASNGERLFSVPGGVVFYDGADAVFSDGTVSGTVTLGAVGDYIATVEQGGGTTVITDWSGEIYTSDLTAGDLDDRTPAVGNDSDDDGAILAGGWVTSRYDDDGDEPWFVPFSGAAYQIEDLLPGEDSSSATGFVRHGDEVLFLAWTDSEEDTADLLSTDGSTVETVVTGLDVTDLNFEDAESTDDYAVIMVGSSSTKVVITDGTAGGTFVRAADTMDEGGDELIVVGDRIVFQGRDADGASEFIGEEVWVTDGTPAGTHPVHNVAPGPDVREVTVTDNYVYGMVDTRSVGNAMVRVDRDDPLGNPVELFEPPTPNAYMRIHGVVGDDLLVNWGVTFAQFDASAGVFHELNESFAGNQYPTVADGGIYLMDLGDLWYIQTDTTPWSETFLINDSGPIYSFMQYGLGVGLGEYLLSRVEYDNGIEEVAVTSPTGVMTVLDTNGSGDDWPNNFQAMPNGRGMFWAQDSSEFALWVTAPDPTDPPVKIAGTEDIGLRYYGFVGNEVVIAADGAGAEDDGRDDVYILKDVLTTPALTRVSDLWNLAGHDRINWLAPVLAEGRSQALVTVRPPGPPYLSYLMLVDSAGPAIQYDIDGGSGNAQIQDLLPLPATASGTPVYFRATSAATGTEPWMFNPSDQSVGPIGDLIPGSLGSVPAYAAAGSVWFSAAAESLARDLWVVGKPGDAPLNVTAPIARDDTAATDWGTPVVVNVLGNDTARTGPAGVDYAWAEGGTVVVNGNGTLTYTPDPTTSGVTDTIHYRMFDDVSFAVASVAVDVGAAEDLVATDDTASTPENTSVNVAVLANDVAGEAATEPLSVKSLTQPANGTATVNGAGVVTYTPDDWFSGVDTFNVVVSDGNQTDTSTATVTVSEEPVVQDRLAGDSRAGTAIEVANASFPDGAGTVLIARQDAYPDALTGAPLAYAMEAPILLTRKDELLPEVAEAIEGLGASRVVILGGVGAVTEGVETSLGAVAGVATVDRIAGDDRFATGGLVAEELAEVLGSGAATSAYLAEGANADPARGWPDALSVSSLAAAQGRPILLATRDRLPDPTAAAITDRGITHVEVIGGAAAVSDEVMGLAEAAAGSAGRTFGASRYETSAAVAQLGVDAGAHPGVVWFATGLNFPDALVAGPAVARAGGVMLLVHGKRVGGSEVTVGWLDANTPVESVTLLGGDGAIAPDVAADIASRLG